MASENISLEEYRHRQVHHHDFVFIAGHLNLPTNCVCGVNDEIIIARIYQAWEKHQSDSCDFCADIRLLVGSHKGYVEKIGGFKYHYSGNLLPWEKDWPYYLLGKLIGDKRQNIWVSQLDFERALRKVLDFCEQGQCAREEERNNRNCAYCHFRCLKDFARDGYRLEKEGDEENVW